MTSFSSTTVRPVFRLMLGLAVLVATIYAAWSAWDYLEARAFGLRLADARAKLSTSPSPTSDRTEFVDDAARMYLAARELIPFRPELRVLDAAFRDSDSPSADIRSQAQMILDESRPAFDVIARARIATVRAWRRLDRAPIGETLSAIVPLLSFRTHVLAREGKPDEALESLSDMLALLRVLERVDRSRTAYETIVLNVGGADLEWLARFSTLPPEALARLAPAFAVDPWTEPESFWLRWVVDDQAPRVPSTVIRPYQRHRLRHVLNLSMQVFEASDRPWPARLRALEQLETASVDEPVLNTTEKKFFASAVVSAQRLARSLTRARAIRVALAIERFRIATGSRPSTLTGLVPAYLQIVPEDPYSGEPLRYVHTERGYRVYGLGLDGKDDGGDLGNWAWDAGSLRYAPDVGVRMEPERQLPVTR